METTVNENIPINSVDNLNVLIIGLKGVGFETAKNIMMMSPAPKKLILHDEETVHIQDLGTNCFLTSMKPKLHFWFKKHSKEDAISYYIHSAG
eukprot:616172_1